MKQNVDITFHPSWWHKNAGTDFDRRFFFDAEWRVERDRDMRRALYEHFSDCGIGERDPAPRSVLFSDLIACGFLYSELLGCEVDYSAGDAPVVRCANLTESDCLEIKAPDLDSSPLWRDVDRQIEYLTGRFGNVESAINLQGIQNIALDLRGQDLFYDYYDEPEAVRALLSAATCLSLDIGRRLYAVSPCVSAGVTSIVKQVAPYVYLTSNCSVTMISEKMYRDFLLEYDTRLAGAFTDFGIHHCGSNMEKLIEAYLDVPNLRFLEIGAGSDLNAVARAIHRRGRSDIVSCIRYSPVKLKTAAKADIEADTAAAIAAFGSDERLCFSCVGIDADVPDEKVKAYLSVFNG
ncbi:MAG: hypothetical protein II920_07555 [Clostridia bacterium]|nr:hypothetical protein [Clostridia bacterium]